MEKTTVYLTAEQKAALAKAAREQGRSEARLIRDGIEGLLYGHRIGDASASMASEPLREHADEPQSGPRWLTRDTFLRQLGTVQADAALRTELQELAPDLTDESPEA